MKADIAKGIVGTVVPVTIAAIPLSDVEIKLRIASLFIGILVGLASFASIVRRWFRDK